MPSSSSPLTLNGSPSVEEEFQRNPELKEEDLQHLRDWNSKQPHLPIVPDDQLIMFLHSCYYSLERAKRTIDANLTIRTHSPEIFSQRDPLLPSVQAIWDVIDCVPLPECDNSGNRVVFCRLGSPDPSKFIHADAVKVFLMAMDTILAEGTQPGYRFIYDVKSLSLGHLYRMNMAVLRKYMVFVQEGAKLRMKCIDVINQSPLLDKFMAIVLPHMKQEMVQMLKFHPSLEDLYKVVPQHILPSDYGGQAGSVNSIKEALKKRLEANRDWYLENEKLKVDESKRRGSSAINAADLFGMEGSFKKLDID